MFLWSESNGMCVPLSIFKIPSRTKTKSGMRLCEPMTSFYIRYKFNSKFTSEKKLTNTNNYVTKIFGWNNTNTERSQFFCPRFQPYRNILPEFVSWTRTHPKPHCICYLKQRLTSVLFLSTVTFNITEVCNNSALKWNRLITNNGLFCDTVVHMKGAKGGWKFKDVIRAIIPTHETDIDITLH